MARTAAAYDDDDTDYTDTDIMDAVNDGLSRADDARSGTDRGRSTWEKSPSREKQWQDSFDDGTALRAQIRGAISGAEKAQAAKDVLDPARPRIADEPQDWGHHLRQEIEWREMPIQDRQKQAFVSRQVQGTNEAARQLGLPPAKTTSDALALHQLVNGDNGQANVAQARSDIAGYDQFYAQNGTSTRQALDQYNAAERLLAERPQDGQRWIAERFDRDGMGRHYQAAAAAGHNLSDVIDHWNAAEHMLASDPINSIAILAVNYGVSPQQIAQALAEAQSLIDSGKVR
jgi:hypothetical protein